MKPVGCLFAAAVLALGASVCLATAPIGPPQIKGKPTKEGTLSIFLFFY